MNSVIKRCLFWQIGAKTLFENACSPSSQIREMGKHWNPKFKRERFKKYIRVPLPNFEDLRRDGQMTPEEMRSKMKEKGVVPPKAWTEKPIFIAATGSVFEAYVPPEGDGKMSLVTVGGAKQRVDLLGHKGKSYMAIRKIKQFEDDFDVPTLGDAAQEIYIKTHNALANKDEDALHNLVTEKCFPELMENSESKTIRWKFIKSLEIPRVVHVRQTEFMSKDNIFAQATVRMHTQQTLAIYDRFGRLMYGSEVIVKDVLEYVVLEKHLSNLYGSWRIHAKIIPDWMPPKDPIFKTYIKPVYQQTEQEQT